jgi:predicted transcriptional regulator
MDEPLELDLRRTIYKLLVNNPGLNLTGVAEHLNISIPLAVYHLQYLEKHNVIISDKEMGYRRYYTKDQIGTETKKILSLLRQDAPLQIVIYLLQHPYAKHKEILTCFSLAPSTVSYHLKKLVDKGIINEARDETQHGYKITDENTILTLLIQYNPSKIVQQFTETWATFGVHQLKKEKKKNDTDAEKTENKTD